MIKSTVGFSVDLVGDGTSTSFTFDPTLAPVRFTVLNFSSNTFDGGELGFFFSNTKAIAIGIRPLQSNFGSLIGTVDERGKVTLIFASPLPADAIATVQGLLDF